MNALPIFAYIKEKLILHTLINRMRLEHVGNSVANLTQFIGIIAIKDCPGNQLANLARLVRVKPTRGHGSSAHANTAGDKRRELLIGDGVLVAGDADGIQNGLGILAGDTSRG